MVSTTTSTSSLLVSAVTTFFFFSSDAFLAPHHYQHSSASSTQHNLFFGKQERQDVRQTVEFDNLEPLPETPARRERLERDQANQQRFETFGDALWELRAEMEDLSHQLLTSLRDGGEDEVETREKLRAAEQRDPELTYKLALAQVELAQEEGRDASEHEATAAAARSCLPQFNLEGLWVGKYGRSYDLINITYVGDTLIAEKVTGENNVPRGALSFQADLHPLRAKARKSASSSRNLQPITLTSKAAQKWGTKKLPRYSGLGQVAEEGFRNAQWIDGQLIIIGTDYFSFAWLPIEQQIFFGRPSPELALKMLRDAGVTRVPSTFSSPPSLQATVDVHKDFATRCLEKTHDYEDEVEGVPMGCIWEDGDSDECYFE